MPLPGFCQTKALGQRESCLNFSGAGKVSFSLVSRGQELAHTRAPQHGAQVGQVLSGTGRTCQVLWKPPLAKSLWDGSFTLFAGPFLVFGPRAGPLCKSHICFVAKLFFGRFVSFWPYFGELVFACSRQLLQGVTWEGVDPSCGF